MYIKIKKTKINGLTIALILFIISPIISTSENSSTFRDIIPSYLLMVLSVVLYNIKFRIEYRHLYALLLWFSAVLSTIVVKGSLNRAIFTYLLFILFYIIVTAQKWNNDELKLVFKVYITIAFVCSLAIIGGVIFNKPYSWNRYSIDILGIHKNPNYVASFISGAYCIVIYSLLHCKKNRIFRFSQLILFMIFMLVGSFFTGTRAALLTNLISTSIIMLPIIFGKLKSKLKLLLLISVVVLSIGTLSTVFKSHIPIKTINRVMNLESYSGGSRIEAWKVAIVLFQKRPILGYGLNGINRHLQSIDTIKYLHNIPLQMLLDQGCIGFGIFIFLITSRIIYVKRTDVIFLLSIGFSLFFPIIFQNGLIAVTFWWPIIIFTILIQYSRLNNKGLKEIFDE